MRKRSAMAAGLLAAGVVATVSLLATPAAPPPSAPPVADAAPPSAEGAARPRDEVLVLDPSAEAPEVPLPLRMPRGEKGPVVVGRLVDPGGEEDPEAWIALEDVEDPAREDPSTVENLGEGWFRMRNVRPGRYRVRVEGDDGRAVYSVELAAVAGHVSDAGTLLMLPEGRAGGAVMDADGKPAAARILLEGRRPDSLARTVVAEGACHGRTGFSVPLRESGTIRIAADGTAGWDLRTVEAGEDVRLYVEFRLRPWAEIRPPADDLPAVERRDRWEIRPVDEGPLETAMIHTTPEGAWRVPAGRYRLRRKPPAEGGEGGVHRTVEVGEGESVTLQ